MPADLPTPPATVLPITDGDFARSLAVDLRPDVDELRHLAAEMGVRPYRVFLAWARWDGGARGEGRLRVAERAEILPRPVVQDMSSIAQALRPVGVSEEGSVAVSEVSPAWTEDLLLGLRDGYVDAASRLGRTLAADVEFWWEVQEQRPTGGVAPLDGETRIRRFRPYGAPHLSRDGFQWRLTLEKADYDVDRDEGITL